MPARDPTFTPQELKALLAYDPNTGLFIWRTTASNRAPAGSVAGTTNRLGYVLIGIQDRQYFAHRLAWYYAHGMWPASEIDHVDGDPSNNRLSNPRLATHSQNTWNTAKPVTNRSGAKGVSWSAGRWRATIKVHGRQVHLGRFDTVAEAHTAYVEAAKHYRGTFARTA